MSRRHHGRPHHHAQGGPDRARYAATSQAPGPNGPPFEAAPPIASAGTHLHGAGPSADLDGGGPRPSHDRAPMNGAPISAGAAYTNGASSTHPAPANGAGNGAAQNGDGASGGADRNGNQNGGQCTAPQLRRFIKSRPYVPMHELRRRFGIVGDDDDVTAVKLELQWVYVGLPSREGGLLGELLRAGEIGFELSLDPRSPIVIGVYPMRPIPRN